MKRFSKIVTLLFTISMVFSFFAVPADAARKKTVEPGNYCIVSALNNKKAVDINGCGVLNGAKVQLWDLNYSGAQRFVLSFKNGYYTIKNANSNKLLDVTSGIKKDGTKVTQWTSNNGTNQKWEIEPAGNGYYYIKSALGNYYLDAQGGSSNNGTQIQIYHGNKTNAQKFKFISDVYYEYKTVSLKFNTFDEWVQQVNYARMSAMGFSSPFSMITNVQIMSYKTIVVSGMTAGKKLLKLPSKIKFQLHKHRYDSNAIFTVNYLHNVQTCSCGAWRQFDWEVPWGAFDFSNAPRYGGSAVYTVTVTTY